MIRIVSSPIGLIIGETVTSEVGMLSLKEPRMMQPINSENNMTSFRIVEILGFPKGFVIGKECMNWDCQDETIISAYRENITGLTLVQKPSLVDKDGKALQ